MQAWLISLRDGTTILLATGITVVGRHVSCQVRIDSSKISRRHCCVCVEPDHVLVRDLGSTNGTWINSQRVDAGTLVDGDILTIGQACYRLQIGTVLNNPSNHDEIHSQVTRSDSRRTFNWESRVPTQADTLETESDRQPHESSFHDESPDGGPAQVS
jgi:hypothetical protein